MGHRRKVPTAGVILRTRKFTDKVTDIDLLMAAEEVQRLGNMYIHDTLSQNETEAQYQLRMKQANERLSKNTENILEQFSVALQHEIDFINNNISGIRGELNISFRPAVKGDGRSRNMLEADLTEVPDRGQYKYVWKIQEDSGESRVVQNNGRMLILRQWMIGKMIRLEAVNTVTNQVLSKEYGPVRNDEVTIEQKKPNPSVPPAPPRIQDAVRRETTSEQKKPNPSVPPAPPKIKDTVRRETTSEQKKPNPSVPPAPPKIKDTVRRETTSETIRPQPAKIPTTGETAKPILRAKNVAYTTGLKNTTEMRHHTEKPHSMSNANSGSIPAAPARTAPAKTTITPPTKTNIHSAQTVTTTKPSAMTAMRQSAEKRKPTPQTPKQRKKYVIPVAAICAVLVVAVCVISVSKGSHDEKAPATDLSVETVIFGAYEQDNSIENGAEPIEWEVFQDLGDYYMLVSKYCLEDMPYNDAEIDTPTTWEDCTLRNWLNHEFYETAFSDEEKGQIHYMLLENLSITGMLPDGEKTTDRVFLLSCQDLVKKYPDYRYRIVEFSWEDTDAAMYVSMSDPTVFEPLQAKYTEYAKEKYILAEKEYVDAGMENDYESIEEEFGENACAWWLRSSGDSESAAMEVIWNGGSTSVPAKTNLGIRPAILVSKEALGSDYVNAEE